MQLSTSRNVTRGQPVEMPLSLWDVLNPRPVLEKLPVAAITEFDELHVGRFRLTLLSTVHILNYI